MSKVTEAIDRLAETPSRPADEFWTHEQAQASINEFWEVRTDKSMSEDSRAERCAEIIASSKPIRNVSENDSGNTVVRSNADSLGVSHERYVFDFDDDFRAAGWLQFDTNQDAWYFGVWVNPKTFQTLTYAEGDVTLVLCRDAEHYNAEIRDACDFYGEGFQFLECNMEGLQSVLLGTHDRDASVVAHRQQREKFLVS
jgi:hypothetical protein